MAELKFAGRASEYVVKTSRDISGAIIINDTVLGRDKSALITDSELIVSFSDASFRANELLVEGELPFKKKFSIMESTSEYKLVEFGKQMQLEVGASKFTKLNILGYDERVDSVIMDTSLLDSDVGYSYAIADNSFSLKLTGYISKTHLKVFLSSCACAIYYGNNRHIEILVSVDDEPIFSRSYDFDITREA